ncbi:HYR domain-containing protein [Lacinutrix sp. MEBiC02595]
MKKNLLFFTLVITIFTHSFNGFSTNVKHLSLDTTSTSAYNNTSLNTEAALFSEYKTDTLNNSTFRTITTCPGPNISRNVDPGVCSAVVTFALPTTNITGGSMVLRTSIGDGGTFPLGTTTVTYEEYDGTSFTAIYCTFDVTVLDNENPVTPTLSPVTVDCNGTLTAPTTTDVCAGNITGSTTDTLSFSEGGSTTINWSFDDGNGNTISVPQTYNYDDTTDPVTPTLASVTVDCNGTLTAPTTTDVCAGSITGTTTDTLSFSEGGSTTINWNFDDGNGNSISVPQTYNYDDTTNPIAPTLASITVDCNGTLTAPTTTDVCAGSITGTTTDTLSFVEGGNTIINWTFDDGNGNIISVPQTYNYDDTTNPVTPTLANITDQCSVAITPPTTTDNCSGTITGTTTTSFPITTQGTTVVIWSFDDGNGNTATQTQNIVIIDTILPSFNSCPSNVSRNNDPGACGAIVNYTIPTATDSCGIATVTQTDVTGLTSGSLFPIGTTTIEYTATDGHGNNTICSFTVIVTDTELPTISCPPNITVNADANCEVTAVTLGMPTTNDNCSVATVTNDLTLPLPVGTHTITWTVLDAVGLSTTCTQTVTVQDVTPPVITCPIPNAFYNTDAGQCDATLSFNATATDNCSATPVVSYEIASIPITFPYAFPLGTTSVDVIADDGNGLTSTCNFTVVVEDNENPIAICQPLTITLDASGNASIAEDAVNNGSSDACGGLTFDTNQTSFDCTNIGVNNVILTVTDANGNTTTCNTTVTILDNVQSATASITSTPVSPICQGESVTFTATGTNLGTTPSYQWYLGGIAVGTDSATYTTTSLNNGDDVYVEITSGPCDTVTISNSIIMTVNPLRPVTFTLNASANPACSGDNLTFFVTGLTNGGATPTYQWYEGATPAGTSTNTYTSSTITNGEIVSVEITSSETCASPIPATESVTMVVSPDATINLTSANNIQTVCNGIAMTNIVYNITDAANAIFTGLPTDLTTNYSGGILTISGSSSQVGIFNYTVSTDGCGSNTASGTITIQPDATINLISSDAYEGLCNSGAAMTPIEFQLSTGAAGAVLTSTPTLPAGITGSFNAGTGVYTISGSTTTVGTYNYTVTTTGCGPAASIDGVIKVYNGPPNISGSINNTGGWPTNICDTPQTATFSVPLDPNVESYNWTFSSSNFTIISSNPNANSVDVYVTETGAFGHSASVTAINPCGTDSVSETVWILNLNPLDIEVYTPDDTSGDADVIYVCEGTTSFQMNGDVGGLSYSDWEWTDNGGIDGTSGSFSTVTSPPTYVCDFYLFGICWSGHLEAGVTTTTVTSTYTFPSNAEGGDIITITLDASTTACSPVADNLEIHILETPVAEITSPDTTICEGESSTITFEGVATSQISVYDGSGNIWYNIQPDGTFSLPVAPTTTTTYTLNSSRYDINAYPGNIDCPIVLNETVTITVNTAPRITAPADITICEGNIVNLSTSSFSGSNAVATWSTSGNGTFTGSIYTPSATDIFNGTVTLTYTNTPSDGICSPVSDSMIVNINELPTVHAGVNQTICSDGSVILNGSIGGNANSYTWSASSGNFSNVNDLNATYTPTITSGSATLTLTVNNPANCGPITDTIVITVNEAASVNAGADYTVCSSDTIVLNGSLGGSATSGIWSSITGGSFGNASVLNTTYNPSPADILAGTVILTLTSNNPTGICGSAIDTVTITIDEAATVDAGPDQTLCASQTLDLSAIGTFGGGATSATWSSNGTSGTIAGNTYTPSLGDISSGSVILLTYTTNNPTGTCNAVSDTMEVTIAPFVTAIASNTTTISSCSDTTIQLAANATGTWSAVSVPAGSPFSFSNLTDPNASFAGESGIAYNITWTIDNPSPCADGTAIVNVNFLSCGDFIDFDGINDNVDFSNNYNLSGNFSIEAWIKPNAINGNIQTILSKRNADNLATGYDLRLVGNNISFRANGSGITTGGITANRWYHIAVTYNGTAYTIYVDGVQRNAANGPSPTTNNSNMRLGAMSRLNNVPTNYYNGWMDEIRIWNTNLSTQQIRQMMNQEIQNNGGQVHGTEIPLDIAGLTWSNLTAYYQMNQSTHITGGNLNGNIGVAGTLRNITSLQAETAPLPYITAANGNWDTPSTWLNNDVQLLPNTIGINWNIVRTQHNVNSGNRTTTVLGLLVDANTFTINNDQILTVNNYLNIDSVLDLEGESQLLQPMGSEVDYSGTGALHRDQQGTTNLYNYNYWGSPVSTNGSTYQIGALHDGVNPVNWTTANDATGSTNPITLSNRWLYLYENYTAGNYADWNIINQNYNIPVGLGFTMKGSGVGDPITNFQNYTFVGQPNNGTIITPVTGGNEALVGNPYPSAIDADLFILENAGSITGPLYFWEHSKTNASHITADYEGGYATYSLTGGTAATTPPIGLGGIGSVGLTPRKHVAVGQGFYVTGDADGGNITFNNSQRAFVKETPGTSVFLRRADEADTSDDIKRVRVNFTSPEGALRPLLLGFTPNNEAGDGVDYGYDALNTDYYPSDMSFIIEGEKYIIQGVGAFHDESMYPVTIDLGISGNIQIALGELENFDEEIDVFIYDALLGTYTRINTTHYEVALDPGSHSDRYFISFKDGSALNTPDAQFSNVVINYLTDTSEIYINVPTSVDIKQVYLVNLLGQTVKSWNGTNAPLSHECKLPVKKISEGTYIIKVRTSDNALINKKIVVKQ